MARMSDGTNVPISSAPASSSNFGSPNGSGSDLDGMGTRRGITTDEKLCKDETYSASASNVPGSARSWPSVEQVDGSTAAGSHGPGSFDDNRNTRRRLDTFSQALKMNMHGVPSYYGSHVNNTTNGLRSGSIIFGKNPTRQPTRI